MPELGKAAAAALGYWSVIESAAREGWNTQRTWQAIRAAADAIGLDRPGVSAAGVAQLRSYAVRIQRAADSFNAGHESNAFVYANAADAPWSRPIAEQNALPMWQIRYEHTVNTPEGPQTEWRTSMFNRTIPDTLGGVRDAIEGDAEQLADKYNTEHVSVGSIQVLRV